MSEITLFLLTLNGFLVSANAALWIGGKKGGTKRHALETTFYKERQKTNPKDFFPQINQLERQQEKLQNQQGNVLLRILTLEELIGIQNESNSNGRKVMAVEKSERVKILEHYLKQM